MQTAHHANTTAATLLAPARFQISRYPAERIDVWALADGRRLLLRPMLPQDAGLFSDWLAGMTPQARRQRFHSACNGVSGARLAAMTDVDHQRHVAFVVVHVENGNEHLVAEARYQVESDGALEGGPRRAEFAILVDEGWQRLGLGARALHTLLKCAASQDVQWLHASVSDDNLAMQALALRCGFSVKPDRDDSALVRVQVAVPVGIQALVLPAHGRPNWLRRLLRRQTH